MLVAGIEANYDLRIVTKTLEIESSRRPLVSVITSLRGESYQRKLEFIVRPMKESDRMSRRYLAEERAESQVRELARVRE